MEYAPDNSTLRQQYVIPSDIGAPGGIWKTHQYDSYGVAQRYPVYFLTQDVPQSYPGYFTVHVKSSVTRLYTLGDFFAVWGQPLGQNNTVSLTSPPSSSYHEFRSSWVWSMCVLTSSSPRHGGWGNEALVKDMQVELLYSSDDCLIG